MHCITLWLLFNWEQPNQGWLNLQLPLLSTSVSGVILDHFLHPLTDSLVFFISTLLCCGPVLNPGFFSKHVLIPAVEQGQKDMGSLTIIIRVTNESTPFIHHTQTSDTLTSGSAYLGKYLWMFPWSGSFCLASNLKHLCSADNRGMCAVYPEHQHHNFL